MSLTPWVARAFGNERVKRRLRGGYQLVVQRPSLLDDFPADPTLRGAFVRDVMPRSERTAMLFVGAELFEQRFRNFQDVDSYHLAEDTQMGAQARGAGRRRAAVIGSEDDFLYLAATASYARSLGGDGLWRVRAAATARVGAPGATDTTAEGSVRVVSPASPLGRLVTEVRGSALTNDTQNRFLVLGGDNGLRGYPINEFDGARSAVWNLEWRTPARRRSCSRAGGMNLPSIDVGGAGARAADLERTSR